MYRRLAELPEGRGGGFSAICRRYRADILPTQGKAHQRAQTAHLRRLENAFGHMPSDSITAQHIYQYMDARRDVPVAVNKELGTLNTLFVKAIRWGMASQNPVVRIERNKITPQRSYVTDAQFQAVYDIMPPMFQVAMELALLTGLRPGDLLSLTRDNLTEEGIRVETSKTDKPLIIEWSDELRSVVRSAQRLPPQLRKPIICNRKGNAYTVEGFTSLWRQRLTDNPNRFKFYDLRAKSASDDTLEASSQRLGHTNTSITERVYRRKPRKVRPLR